LAVDGAHLVAVNGRTCTLATGNVWGVGSTVLSFKVVKLSNLITGTYPTITYMQYKADDFTTTLTTPTQVMYTNTSATIPGTALAKGNALSIYITSLPTLTAKPTTVWFTVSLWVSTITKEA